MNDSNKIGKFSEQKRRMVLTAGDTVGVLFSRSRVHFQIRKCVLVQMKNGNKIAEKSEENWGMVSNICRVQGSGPNMVIYSKIAIK